MCHQTLAHIHERNGVNDPELFACVQQRMCQSIWKTCFELISGLQSAIQFPCSASARLECEACNVPVQRMLAEKKSMHGVADLDRDTMHYHQTEANFFFSSATQARAIGKHFVCWRI